MLRCLGGCRAGVSAGARTLGDMSGVTGRVAVFGSATVACWTVRSSGTLGRAVCPWTGRRGRGSGSWDNGDTACGTPAAVEGSGSAGAHVGPTGC